MDELKLGTLVKLHYGGSAKIVSKLKDDGVNPEYIVECNSKKYILKWQPERRIFGGIDVFINKLKKNINVPFQNKNILWPIDITDSISTGVGCLVPMPPSNYKKLYDVVNDYSEVGKIGSRTAEFISLDTVIKIGLNLIKIFNDVHRKGLFFEYVDEESFYVDIKTGDVLLTGANRIVCHNDTHIGGRVEYISPEVIMNDSYQSIQTDEHTLAVILFRLLFRAYPIIDTYYARLEDRSSHKFGMDGVAYPYGYNLAFIYQEDVYIPDKYRQGMARKLWEGYPKYIRQAFVRAFVEDIRCPEKRIIDKQWYRILEELKMDISSSSLSKQGFYKKY